MDTIKPLFTIATLAILLAGCSSIGDSISSIGSYVGGSVEDCPEIEAPVSGVVPVAATSRKIAVLPVTDELTQSTDNSPARELRSRITAIAADQDIELLDESDNTALEERIRVIDSGGTARRMTDESVEILKTEITSANMTYRFQEAETVTMGGEDDVKPAYCVVTARVLAEARLYSGAPLELTLTVPLTGVHEQQVEMDDDTCPVEPEVYNQMYRLAAADAANDIARIADDRALFNEESFVREVRMCFNKKFANYAWLSTAPDDVSRKGTKVNIYRQYWFKDKLKNEVMIRRTLVASGKITESENDDEIWVKISDRNDARKIMLGDIATLDD